MLDPYYRARPRRLVLITEDEAIREMNRPRTRGDCVGGQRPCPWSSCRYHLMVDVNYDTGGLKKNFPELDVSALKETCALDVADAGGITLEEVGSKLGLTRERVRQIEHNALTRLHKYLPRAGVDSDD